MLVQHKLFAITRRGALVLFITCLLSIFSFAGGTYVPLATSLTATSSGSATYITISSTAPMAYSVTRPGTRTLLIDLPGVDTSRLAASYSVGSALVENVSVERDHGRGAQSAARLRVSLRLPVRDRSQLSGNNLVLVLSPESAVAVSADPSKTTGPIASSSPVSKQLASNAASTTKIEGSDADQQPRNPVPSGTPRPNVGISAGGTRGSAAQGQQYGQSTFVGEPINLNVVNADIRDILSYITEQYGVNFVIDSSVGSVPVTVNVTDVPWNVALDAILRANRLGIDVNGNILRVATIDVLATEASSQEKIRDAQLNNSPLVTEFIRLNYARAAGTLAQAAGSTGNFAGGAASASASVNSSGGGNGGGAASGGGSDQGVLPIISRRLSRRGSVEVDGRSNTLIVTDVKENINSIRQLVTLLDQPEPQVEIETRIVIANRNFSRDLGVQLGAVAVNTGRGGLGSFSTLPANKDISSGVNPGGVPGGLGNTTQPVGSLAAAAASTVIGLTTGRIGTAQISALITAAESKGQAKVIATPRVTALNNRPAQIESGSQIPVQTTQASGGGAIVSTTFVSVPLRLSITPQITDVGTVVLRVTVENNTLNQAIAVAGVPGIDTQRMQSEVLVPDGGTTVMGGVLADNEAETQQRTPGISGIPVLGNLFKRKQTVRSSSEILFFITPRIYRPDYQGQQTSGVAATGTRSTTISQPVPLGNPQSNTPTPQQLQQQQQQYQQQNVPNNGQPAFGTPLQGVPVGTTPNGMSRP